VKTHHCTLSMLRSLFGAAAASAVLWGCSADVDAQRTQQDEAADRIAPFDDPSGLLGTVSRRVSDVISPADVGGTFGVEDERVPYPDTYWPMADNGIDARWNGDAPSPLEKFLAMTGGDLDRAKTWNRLNHGADVPGVQSWFGICQGWTAAAIAERPVQRAVRAKIAGGRVAACEDGDAECVSFEIGDVNGLLAEVYSDAAARFIGARCDTAPSRIRRDAYGRIDRLRNGAGCKGLNPGALLIVLAKRMKNDRMAMAIDAQNSFNTDQIWNQPAYRYTVHRYEALTEAEAANLVARGTRSGSETRYRWNARAHGFAFVDLSLHWVAEHGPNVTYVSGLSSTRTTRVTAVIELSSAGNTSATIVGGEYIDDPSVGTDRLTVAPFVWLPTGPGNDAWGEHNPEIRSALVLQLAALGADD